MRTLLRQLAPAAIVLLLFTIVCGVVYPLAVTAIGQTAMRHQANGSIVTNDGVAIGSTLVGQGFTEPRYFHPRPSAAGTGYDAMSSSGSNLGPNNPDLLKAVGERVSAYRLENNLNEQVMVPVDAVTASGSGLDPHISIANARLQAARVADARGVSLSAVNDAITAHTERQPLGMLGDSGVNVLAVNLALDRLG